MASSKGHLADPAARFVTDFTSLIKDVDRLMVDLRAAADDQRVHRNGNGSKPNLNGTISTLREHARSFVQSLQHFGNRLDRVPVSYLELDGNAHILWANQECAEMLNGSGVPLRGKSLFSFV